MKINTNSRIMQILKRMKLVSQYGTSIAITTSFNILLAILSILTGVLVARLLGPTGRGELSIIQIYPQFLATLSLLGMSEAVAYYSANERESAGSFLISGLFISLLACIPFFFLGYVAIPKIIGQYPNTIVASSQSYLFFLPVNAVLLLLTQSLRGRNHILFWNILRVLPSASWLIILLSSVVNKDATPSSLASRFLLASALLILIFWLIGFRGLSGPFRVDLLIIKKLLFYGMPIALSGLPLLFNLRLDQLLLPKYIESKFIGYYAVAVSWSTIANPMINAVSEVMLPKIASNQSSLVRKQLLAQTIRLGVLLSFGVGVIAALVAPLIIPIFFGPDFREAVPVSILLSLASCFLSLNLILRSGALSLAKPKIVLLVESSGFICTIILLYFLLIPYQIIGAALASLFSYAISSVAFIYCIHQAAKISIKDIVVPQMADFHLIYQKMGQYIQAFRTN